MGFLDFYWGEENNPRNRDSGGDTAADRARHGEAKNWSPQSRDAIVKMAGALESGRRSDRRDADRLAERHGMDPQDVERQARRYR
jgi:hypothetical protein